VVILALGVSVAWATGAPQVGELWTSDVVAGAATLNGEVSRNALSTIYRFEYVSAAEYEVNGFAGAVHIPAAEDATVPSGAPAFTEVSQHPSALKPDTRYRYRLVAENSAGTAASPPFSFATQSLGGTRALLDGRGWEMVSPADKNGGAIQGFGQNFGGDVLQAAAAGGAITYSSLSSFGQDAPGAPPASQYISRRGATGWPTENITTPTVSGAYGDKPDGVPYQLFSSDLGRGVVFDGQTYDLRNDEDGSLAPMSPTEPDLSFAGAGPDLRHVVLSTCAALTADAIEVADGGGCDPLDPNLYEYFEGQLHLVNILPAQTQGTPGAKLAAQSGAVSDDGSRVYWTEGGNVYLREGTHTVQVDDEVGGGGRFETATPDGSFAFFTEGGHLYRYEARFEDLSTIDLTPSGGVLGVLGASEDGSCVYYATAAGLFLWQRGTTREVATAADPSDYPPTTGTARVSADGSHLLFLSRSSLTGYDNTDASTGEPDTEVFLYDAEAPTAEAFVCISCNPTEERPIGPSTIPGATPNGRGPQATQSYKPRVLTAGGKRVFFDSRDALLLSDTDNAPDVYEWEADGTGGCATTTGCLGLISKGKEGGASFVDADDSGSDAFFLTGVSLVPWADPGSVDVYDAREGGGFPPPSPPPVCDGDSCQPLPSPPEDRSVGTLSSGPGNPAVRYSRHRHHRKRRRGNRARR
jgi:hypothetical protein